ncbi:MAG: phage tail tip fiber protein [Pontibacterium sp.]
MAKRKTIPPVPSRDPRDRQFFEAVKEAVEVGGGHRGDPFDRFLSVRDLVDANVIAIEGNASRYISSSRMKAVANEADRDLTTPPAPTGLTASSGIGIVFLTWDNPGYGNHGHTNVYRSSEDNFANATVMSNVVGQTYADYVPYELIDGETRGYYYWITSVSEEGVEGPPNEANGVYQTPKADPEYMLSVLEGRVTESQLHNDLNSRINLIDGPDSLAGSVAARIAQEATERTEADAATAETVTQLSTKVNDNTATIEQHASSIDGLETQWSVKMDVNGYVSGVGMNNDGESSSFQILASNFAVYDPANPTKMILGTVDGVAVIDGAFIKSATIQDAAIGSLSVDKLVGNKANWVEANINTLTAVRLQSDDGKVVFDLANKYFYMEV